MTPSSVSLKVLAPARHAYPPPATAPTELKGKAKSAARGNKGNWNSWLAEDDAELRALVAQHGKNSWVKVGRELSRPRSGYAVMSRWYEHVTKALAAEKELAEGGLIHLGAPFSRLQW